MKISRNSFDKRGFDWVPVANRPPEPVNGLHPLDKAFRD